MKKGNPYLVPYVLITSLFFLWGLAHNLNPILIPHLKKACQLTDFESALIDSAFFVGYFVMAIPAGLLMKRYGYKAGILVGLLLFTAGAFLFYPAAEVRVFSVFLLALFIIASGLTFLETAANPYVITLGNPASATQRLNLSQSFNGLAATLAPLLGGLFILSGRSLSDAQLARFSPAQLDRYLQEEAAAVQAPYAVIGATVLLVALLIWRTRLPQIPAPASVAATSVAATSVAATSGGSIWQEKQLLFGVVTQFFYVGAQVCVSSFFIRLMGQTAGLDERTAAYYLSVALLGFMLGRFVGVLLMRYIAPNRLLALYGLLTFLLLGSAVLLGGPYALYALIAVQFFMSIMFPTIFSLSIYGLGDRTEFGSSLVIMAIAGGAIFPVLMGRVSDLSGIQTAYIVPTLCFLVVLVFGLTARTSDSTVLTPTH